MKYRTRTETEIPFPLAPMIDLTFLLLIFFMVTSRISQEPVQETIRLPVANMGQIPKEASHREMIDLSQEGKISIAKKPMNRRKLGDYLRLRLQNHPQRKIYLRADAATSARHIKEMITIATKAGADRIFLSVFPQ